MNPEIVSLVDVGHTFGGRRGRTPFRALHPLTVSFGEGQSLALVGESGSGKTTLLRLLLGLTRPTEGRLRLFGVDPAAGGERATAARRRCGYIPQDPFGALPPTLTVIDAVAEPLRLGPSPLPREAARERARHLLKLCLLEESLWDVRAGTSLSGGQRQRVSFARALIADPDLLLADEPTSMQDSGTRRLLVARIAERSSRGKGLLFVTHDLVLARAVTERALVLLRGRAVEEGPTEALLREPLHPYTKALVAALPRLGKALTGPPPSLGTAPPGGCPFLHRCPSSLALCASSPPFTALAGGRKVACHLFRERAPSTSDLSR